MFILEGNIGAGKSTFIRILKELIPSIDTAFEPLAQWDAQGDSLLGRFMEDPKRWAFTMETFVMSCRFRDHVALQDRKNVTLVERSLYSGHYVFAVNSKAQGFMTSAEWASYESLFNYLVLRFCCLPWGFIYLRVDPEVAYERVCKRSRDSEAPISLDYLKQIHDRHERFLVAREVHSELKKIPVLIIDGNGDFEGDSVCANLLKEQVIEFLHLHNKLGDRLIYDRAQACI